MWNGGITDTGLKAITSLRHHYCVFLAEAPMIFFLFNSSKSSVNVKLFFFFFFSDVEERQKKLILVFDT